MYKSDRFVSIVVLVVFLAVLIISSPRPAAALNNIPDLLGPTQTLNQNQSEIDPLTLRVRGAQLNLPELDQVRSELERGQTPAPIALSLFADVRLLAHFERVEYPITGGYSLAGKVGDDSLSEIHLSRIGNTFYASLNTPQGLFRISSQDGQTARIVQVDSARFRPEHDAIPLSPLPPALPAVAVVAEGASSVDDGSRIDVYVGYTPAAKAATAALGQDILDVINTAIAETNTGYAASGVNQRVVLVGTAEYAYTEPGNWITMLNNWSGTSDGYMDAAHTARDLTKADEMVLLVNDVTSCGIAWLMGSGSISPAFAPNAFSVVAWDCATGYYSFGHEMGHNMGAGHNREAGTGVGAYPDYSYGNWIWMPDSGRYDYRTIMAYNTNGYVDINRSGNTLSYNSTRVNRWANPDTIYAGQPTGAGLSAPYPAYDALTLNNTATAVAQFRDGDAPTAPTGLVATRLSATSLQLDWTDTSSDETRFRIERASAGVEDWAEVGVVGSNLTTYVDSSLQANSNYRYRVLSDNGNGRTASIEYSIRPFYADNYEPDDACVEAHPITLNGAAQVHTFHQVGDMDWVWFDVTIGKTYILQTSEVEVNADTILELRSACSQPLLARNDNTYGQDARITWQSSYTGRVYANVTNLNPNIYGPQTGYNLSVRLASLTSVAVIVGGHNDGYSLQSNIDYSTDMAYRTLLNSGVPKPNIKYFGPNPNRDVDGNGFNDDIAGLPTPTAIRDAIQDWARAQGVTAGVPFLLYLADHGYYDQFIADGTEGKIGAADLNLWLSNLETTSGANMISVIIEACKSGSFIDITNEGPARISAPGRVVITSTSSTQDAFSSLQGSRFSDIFWTELGQNVDLKTAFDYAKQAIIVTGVSQQPWLDDNGDSIANNKDGDMARNRGLGGTYAGTPPIVDSVRVTFNQNGSGTIHSQVRDDFGVSAVWAEIYDPDFVEPQPSEDGSTPQLNLPTVTLTNTGDNQYQTSFSFNKLGRYRIVVYARDGDSNIALPGMRIVYTGSNVFIPALYR